MFLNYTSCDNHPNNFWICVNYTTGLTFIRVLYAGMTN